MADIEVDMVADMEVDMVVDIELDKVADNQCPASNVFRCDSIF